MAQKEKGGYGNSSESAAKNMRNESPANIQLYAANHSYGGSSEDIMYSPPATNEYAPVPWECNDECEKGTRTPVQQRSTIAFSPNKATNLWSRKGISGRSHVHMESFLKASQSGKPGGTAIKDTDLRRADIETSSFGAEHMSVRIQGMDCTGCEKKLRKSLTSLAELSNIKTSLLLAQAEFDLVPSKFVDGGNIARVIEKMTGFTCAKLAGLEAQLEVIMENPHNLANDWPNGVIDLTVLSQDHVLITYQPRVVGARKLISDPFFQNAKLAPPTDLSFVASGKRHLYNTCYMTLLSIVLTVPVLVLTWARIPRHEVLYGAISLILATVIQTVVAGPFYIGALKALMYARVIDMDLLIVLSSSTAYIYSLIAFAYLAAAQPLPTGEFFQTSTLLVTLIMIGRAATAFARQRSIESFTMDSLQVPTATIVHPLSGDETEIDARLLEYDDIFKVLPDTPVVTDRLIIRGESEVDESMVTGEATAIVKYPGRSVVAGSVNHSGVLIIRATHLPCENTVKTIAAMVDEAKSSKAKIQELADRVASYFVPAIIGTTMVVFFVWVVVGKFVRHQSAAVSSINAMTFAIAVLIVSCPCAIGLAVPMVVLIATGVAARQGLIVKTAETIDLARNVTHVVFDKTGTLTQETLHVTTEEYLHESYELLQPVILGLTTTSAHPVSKAITAHLNLSSIQRAKLSNVISLSGNGTEAGWNGSLVRAGNPHWLGVQDAPEVRKVLHLGLTLLCVTLDSKLVAVFGLQSLLRPDALGTVTELKKRCISISILSGDNEAAVQAVAMELGIPAINARARCTPAQKQAYVSSLLEPTNTRGHVHCESTHPHQHPHRPILSHSPVVLFVGDGTNDAPSLAQASIGLHISASESSAIASTAADAILLRPALTNILTLIDLSRAFHRRVLFNFIWSAVYNLVAVILAAGAVPKFRIPPAYAGLGEVVSVLPVLAAAVGLRFWRR